MRARQSTRSKSETNLIVDNSFGAIRVNLDNRADGALLFDQFAHVARETAAHAQSQLLLHFGRRGLGRDLIERGDFSKRVKSIWHDVGEEVFTFNVFTVSCKPTCLKR